MNGSSKMDSVKLSVVLPNFNHADFIETAVEAILRQSLPPDEIIIVDDGSTDASREIIETLAREHPSIRPVYREKNEGTHAAVLAGRQRAQGHYIYFAASDDEVLPGLFERSLALLDAHTHVSFSSANTEIISESGDIISSLPNPIDADEPLVIRPDDARELLLKHGSWFRCNTAIYRRKILDDLGGFDRKLGPFGDGFICSMLALRDGCIYIPSVLGRIRALEGNLSSVYENDVGKSLGMFTYAKQLIQSDYSQVFDHTVVDAWEKRWRYGLARRMIYKDGMGRWSVALKPIYERMNRLDGWVLDILQADSPLARKLASAYLLARFARLEIPGALKNLF